MLKVKITDIYNEIKLINSYIDQYNEINLSIFHALKMATSNWQDMNSIKFGEEIYKQKLDCDKFLNGLNARRDIWQYLYENYSKFGNEISVNLDSKKNILDHLNAALEKNYIAIDKYNYLYQGGLGYYYVYLAGTLATLGSKIDNITNVLIQTIDKFNSLFSELERLETEICKKIDSLETIHMSELELHL